MSIFWAILIVLQTATPLQPTQQPSLLSSSEISQLQTKAKAGDASAQEALGRAYQKGNGVRQSDELAAQWYRKAADQGDAVAQNDLGIMYRTGAGVEKNKEEAVKWYRKAAQQGNANALFNLGTAYYNGDGVGPDSLQAYDWFLLADDAGSENAHDAVVRTAGELGLRLSTQALVEVAEMYESGRSLRKSYPDAIKWYRKGVEQKDPVAMVHLAALYINGAAVSADYPQALELCKEAALLSPAGKYCFGYMLQHGLGTAPDPKKAVEMYRVSAEQRNSDSALALAQMYAKGDGVNVDKVESFYWFFLASAGGDGSAQKAAADLLNEMDKKERKRLDGLLRKNHLDPKYVFERVSRKPA
ncbi:MAG: tetratricopeptide repeat protein [Terriglobales bacterium]